MPKKPQLKVQQAKQAMYHDAIVEAAESVFAQLGYEATGMREVASQAGVSVKTLYGYFPGKLELYQEINDIRGKEIWEAVIQSVYTRTQQPESTALASVLEGIRAYMQFFHAHPNYTQILLNEGYLSYGEGPRDSGQQEWLWDLGQMFSAAAVETGKEGGEIIDDDTDELVDMMNSLLQVRLARWVHSGMQMSGDDLAAKAQAEFVRLFCTPETTSRLLRSDGLALK